MQTRMPRAMLAISVVLAISVLAELPVAGFIRAIGVDALRDAVAMGRSVHSNPN
jgi:hypothetical protein